MSRDENLYHILSDAEELLPFRSEPDWTWTIVEDLGNNIVTVNRLEGEEGCTPWGYIADRRMLIPIESK